MTRILLDWLIERYPTAKRQTLKRMVESGRVTINGRRGKTLKDSVSETDRVAVDERKTSTPLSIPAGLRILHEDADILVVDKPVGLLTSTVPREPRPTLWAMVCDYLHATDPNARPGLIHRLDRDASGLLIFSRNDGAYQSLKTQFFNHTVSREYAVLVHGTPNPRKGRIETQLVERTDGTVHSTRQTGKGQIAVTEYEVIKSSGEQSLLRVILQTGRKHQIRVHFSEKGCPILGDTVYGDKDNAPRLMLAATRLTIRHPRDNRQVTFTAPARDFADLTLP